MPWVTLVTLLLSPSVLYGIQNGDSELRHFSLQDVREAVKHSHVLLGLSPETNILLGNVKWLYRNEDLEVGIWTNKTKINWVSESENINDEMFAFFEKETSDRKCLLVPNFMSPLKANRVVGDPFSLKDIVNYLNDKCFTFLNIDGTESKEGKRRKNILKKLYDVKRENHKRKCDRISLPTTKEFVTKYLFRSKPVIIENAINDWPALNTWTNQMLREKYGEKTVHVKLTPDGEFEGCDEAKKFDNFHTFSVPQAVRKQLQHPDLVVVRPAVGNMKFAQFLDMIENKDKLYNISAYLEYSSIREHFPELESDVKSMSFIDGLLKLSNLNIWLSNGNTLGKLHFDPFDNFLCQLRGNKNLTLFDPHNNYNLYESHIQEAILSYDSQSKKFRNFSLLDSTSMVMSPVDISNPNVDRFPNFTRAHSIECYLNEGDVLFMPSFWWHEVQSYPNKYEKRNLAVNFWYKPLFEKEFPCAECKLDVNPLYRKFLQLF